MGLVENMLHSKSLTMATSVNNSNNEGRSGKPRMENEDCTFLARPMYKRRKVSAIRDYPAGCGRFVPRIDLMPNVDAASFGFENGTIVKDKSGEDSRDQFVRTSKHQDELQHSEFLISSFSSETLGLWQTNDYSLKKENSVVSSNYLDKPPLPNDEPARMKLVGLEALEDTELTKTAEAVKCDSSSMSKELPKMGPSPDGEVVLSGSSKFLSLDANIAGSSDCSEKAITRRHLPQRRVSAIRDFPPLCGRNAPLLSKDGCLEGISSLENKSVGQQNLAVDDKALERVAATDVIEMEKNVKYGDACEGRLVDVVRGDFEGNSTQEVNKSDRIGPSSEMKLPLENTRDKCIAVPDESNFLQVVVNSQTVVKEENSDAVQLEGTSGKEIIVYSGLQSLGTKTLGVSGCHRELIGDFNGLQASSDRITVLGLMSESECPWRNGKGSSKFKLIGGTNESKGKKVDFFARYDRSKAATKSKDSINHSGGKPLKKKKGSSVSEGMGQLVIWEKKDSFEPNQNMEELHDVPRSCGFNVNVPPFGHGNLSSHDNDSNVTRNKVRETLRLFQAVSRKLLQEEEAKSKDRANTYRRIDLQAAKILKEKGKYVNTGKQILGLVPGVEVGDEFQYRVELNIIGLHRQIQGGIDYVVHNGKVLATSVVASGGYADELDNSDVLIYTGQGGNVIKNDKEPEDQKLERGNLALKNSVEEKNPVRVIRGSESMDGKCKRYIYDGLYEVETYWQDMGSHGKLVFRFRLRRIPGQPGLAWNEVRISKKFKIREGLCVDDISNGKESIPICAVNTVDDEKPPPFNYTTRMIYPGWCNPIPSEGCSCINGCSDSEKCSCAVKNGGEIPFNYNGAIVQAKPLVYECGASCKCPSTCHNRVSQHGIKFQLEIFKTKTRGWGVRSLNSIPSGSFICEYIGELLEEKEAEQRTGNDEYLFDIGNNYNNTLWDGLSSLMPDAQSSSCKIVEDVGFTIDAAQYGNVGRFINHSCSPNLYAQNVLYDHDDKRIPHIMLFAAENIPPLQELTYDYNYMIDQVHDSDGNIKKKDCFCGSVECTGRMY